jgi:hypothetical protein
MTYFSLGFRLFLFLLQINTHTHYVLLEGIEKGKRHGLKSRDLSSCNKYEDCRIPDGFRDGGILWENVIHISSVKGSNVTEYCVDCAFQFTLKSV